jgi:hypothetical protein
MKRFTPFAVIGISCAAFTVNCAKGCRSEPATAAVSPHAPGGGAPASTTPPGAPPKTGALGSGGAAAEPPKLPETAFDPKAGY